jgi:hypothetical protein
MSKSLLENMHKAEIIHERATERGITDWCMVVVQRALGVSPAAGTKKPTYTRANVGNHKVETSFHMELTGPLSHDEMSTLVNNPTTIVRELSKQNPDYVQAPYHKRRHLGLVVEFTANRTTQLEDHGFVILPPRRFAKNMQKRLFRSDNVVVVDAGDGRTVFCAGTGDLTQRINQHLTGGGGVDMFYVQKKDRK